MPAYRQLEPQSSAAIAIFFAESDKYTMRDGLNEIGILVYPGVQQAAVLGLTDIFKMASIAQAERGAGSRAKFRFTHWLIAEGEQPSRVLDSNPQSTQRPDILIIPPTLDELPNPSVTANIATWLQEQHRAGTKIASVCSGAFLLAETGLLTGRRASTHPKCERQFSAQFPDIRVDIKQRLIDDGDLITAGGFLAWVDIALLVLDRLIGSVVCAEVAKFIAFDPGAREARYFVGFAPMQAHGDRAILNVQDWVHLRDGHDVSVEAMAQIAHLGRRTFHRRFTEATGMTPMRYCSAVRMARARELLEFGRMPTKQISASLGYEDFASFTRAFRRAFGLPPAAYRKRFGLGGAGPSESSLRLW